MKKILLILLIILPVYFSLAIYFLDKEYFLCPIKYTSDILVRSDSRGKGYFASPRNGNRFHEGIDLFAPIGSPVFAARCGRVVRVGSNKGMGNYVIVRHGANLSTLYGHLLKINVGCGEFIRQGDLVGQVGKTGNANFSDIQPHLHFEVRNGGIPEDPLEFLR